MGHPMPKYTFHTNHIVPVSKSTFQTTAFTVEADNPEAAYALVLPKFPEGSRLFCWYLDEPIPKESEKLADLVDQEVPSKDTAKK